MPPPEFPEISTAVYSQYAKNVYVAGLTTYTNVYIPANVNPTINNCTIKGVLYIKAPNKVTISGTTTLQCVIVSDPAVAFNASTNQINIIGTVTAQGVGALPNGYDPVNDPRNEVPKLTGAFIIAPGFSTILGGNMGTVGGSIVTGQFTMIGTASGTIKGSVIVMQDQLTQIGGTAAITIASTGTTQYPPGITFGHHYATIPGSYLEVMPDLLTKQKNGVLQVNINPALIGGSTTQPAAP